MIGVTWRQHRLQILIVALLLVLLALFLLITGLALASYYQANVAGCVASYVPPCSTATFDEFENYVGSLHVLDILPALPALVGLFIGAPLLAWEFEHGTYLLAWTQGVTRQYWLAVKLCILIVMTLGAFLLLQLLITWWNGPVVTALGPFTDFDVTGVVPLAYALFALLLGVAVGTRVGRSIGAVATTLALFIALRVGIGQLRTYFLPALSAIRLDGQANLHRRDWIIDYKTVDHLGHIVDPNPCLNSTQPTCMLDRGLKILTVYHPASQFWAFQGIEAAIFLLLAGVMCVLTFRWVRHRVR